MRLKEYKNYLKNLIDTFSTVSKKSKRIAFIFTIIVGLLCACPIVFLIINLFMQFLGIKVVILSLIALCGVLFHLLISLMYPMYYVALNELNKDFNIEVSYKKLFVVSICDLFQIGFIIIMIILMNILVINMFF